MHVCERVGINMSPIKRIVYFATGVLFILFAYQGSLFPDLPSEARTTFLLITIGMGIISVRMTMAAHSSIMLAERTASPEQRALIDFRTTDPSPVGLGQGIARAWIRRVPV
jgi:hypothetical protein